MGIVYLARDVRLDRPVAIKLLPPELAESAALRGRFLREARLAAKLSHPNIVPIHAVEEVGAFVLFVMAYITGETLGHRLRERGPVPPAEATRILRDVAWALAYAHAQGIVHRDVKPDNILLEAGGRRCLVADFGIAREVRTADSAAEPVTGTVEYMSPEQARGDVVDGRSDLYSLGMVGYQALSGRLPHQARQLSDLIQQQLAGRPASLAETAPHLGRALCRTIDHVLAYYPAARYKSADAFAEALDGLNTTVMEQPAPLRLWLAKGSRSKSGFIALSLGGLLYAVAGLSQLIRGGEAWSLQLTLFGMGVMAFPWLWYGAIRLLQTRKVLKAGYTHADLVLALESQMQRRREELAFEFGAGPTWLGRWVFRLTVMGIGVAAGGTLLSFFFPQLWEVRGFYGLVLTAVGTALLGVALGRVIPGGLLPPKDRWGEWKKRLWEGRLGTFMTGAANWRLGPRAAPESTMHRPTEIALGQASEALFKALPATHRRGLASLPAQIEFLSRQAQRMRARIEELDDLIAEAAPDTLFDGERAAGDGGAGALTAAREAWQSRLGETVMVLESIRVGLLRLHAGSVSAASLTADLDAARELQQRLARLAEGHAEIDASILPKTAGP